MSETAEKLPGKKAEKPTAVSDRPVPQSDSHTVLNRAAASVASSADPRRVTHKGLLSLQRTIGNRRVQRLFSRNQSSGQEDEAIQSKPDTTISIRSAGNPVAESFHRPDTHFRVPEFDRIKAAYEDKTLNIPESVIKDRVARLLGRMRREKRLKTKERIPKIIAKIFPGPGKIDETEFENAVDTSDRESVYKDVNDANTAVKPADEAKLKSAIADSIALISTVEADAAGLTAVFGSKSATAKANYAKARASLDTVSKGMATHITTDYNLDDPEVGLGGWANFSSQHMHLLLSVAQVNDLDDTKITLIHEASHLADSSVDDLGYYGSPGFEGMTEDEKVCNAAHYEELPARVLGKSSFPGATFTPGATVAGKPLTRKDKVKRKASEHLRMAWDAAVDTHSFIRDVRKAQDASDTLPFSTNKAFIIELSKLIDLTVHKQSSGKEIITMLDVSLMESVARAMSLFTGIVDTVAFPRPIGKKKDLTLRNEIIMKTVAKYGNLLKDPVRDKKAIDWFAAHYRSIPSV